MKAPRKGKPRTQSVTMRLNKDGTITMRSYGGFDLRKVLGPAKQDDPK